MKSSDESMKKKKNKIIHSVFQFFPLLKINDPDVRMIYLKRQSHEIFATLIFLIALYLYRYELAKKFHEILTLLKLLLFVIYSTVHYEVTFEST